VIEKIDAAGDDFPFNALAIRLDACEEAPFECRLKEQGILESVLSKIWSDDMRKALAHLDDEKRSQLIYLADLGTAVCLSGLVVSILHAAGNLF
jgi:hypothetical protein